MLRDSPTWVVKLITDGTSIHKKFHRDVKVVKVPLFFFIVYSDMIYAIGISAYSVSLYHLINHAFFKALLFLSAGSLIHALSDEQDLRRMGALRKILAFTYVNMLIGSISLMGIPYTSGFYSKEVILGLGYSSPNLAAGIGYWLCLISALFTTIYSIRLLNCGFLVIGNENRSSLLKGSHEPDFLMTIVLAILALASVCVGYGLSDIFANSSDLFQDSLFVAPHNLTNTHLGGSLYPLGATLVGALAAFALNIWFPGANLKLKTSSLGSKLYRLLIARYFFDAFYSALTKLTLKLGWLTAKELDKGLGEFLGPTGLYYFIHKNPKTTFSLTEIETTESQFQGTDPSKFTLNSPKFISNSTLLNENLSYAEKTLKTLDNLSFNAPHFLISKSPIVYGQYIILSLFLTLASLIILNA